MAEGAHQFAAADGIGQVEILDRVIDRTARFRVELQRLEGRQIDRELAAGLVRGDGCGGGFDQCLAFAFQCFKRGHAGDKIFGTKQKDA